MYKPLAAGRLKYDMLIFPRKLNISLEKTYERAQGMMQNIRIKRKITYINSTTIFETEKGQFSFPTSTFKMATSRYSTHAQCN